MAEPLTNVLGVVAIKHCGEYDATIYYEKLNVVTYNGSSYCAKSETQGHLPTDANFWDLIAEKGEQGETGDKGDKGDIGVPGGRPLVASSISDMTDTTSVYVNTTDGHWYWYSEDDTSWEDGGIYQSTEIEDGSITYSKTDFLDLEINKFYPYFYLKTINGVNFIYNKENGEISINGTSSGSINHKIGKFKTTKQGTYKAFINEILFTTGYVFEIRKKSDSSVIGRVTSSNKTLVMNNLDGNTIYEIYLILAGSFSFNEKIQLQVQLGTDNLSYVIPKFRFTSNNEEIKYLKKGLLLASSNSSIEPYIVAKLDFNNNTLKFAKNNLILIRKNYDYMRTNYVSILNNVEYELISYDDNDNPKDGYYLLFMDNNYNLKKINYVDFTSIIIDENDIYLGYYFINNGKIDTYEFNFKIVTNKGLSEKLISICGVSIDTYENYIPSPNIAYYPAGTLNNVKQMWWKKLIDKTGMTLLKNNSWTGARATTTNNNQAHPDIQNYKVTSSGVHRCLDLNDENTNPDFIIIGAFALNDFGNSNIGNYTIGTDLPDKDIDLTINENYEAYQNTIESYEGAMATIFYRVQQKYPTAKIFVMDSYNFYMNGREVPYMIYNNSKLDEYNQALYKIARIFGVEVIKISECGITSQNAKLYCVDNTGDTVLHPNDEGQTFIYREVLKHLKKYITE